MRTEYVYNLPEVATALVKHTGLREGYWMLTATFALGAEMVTTPSDDPKGTSYPAAIVPLHSLGLARCEMLSSLSVDAAVVNPRPRAQKRRKV